jgi:hypothetical protein
MLKSMLSIAAAAMLTFAASAAQAMPPVGDIGGVSSPHVVLVAGGCGPGFHRGPYGHCVPNAPVPYWQGPGWRYYNGCWRGPNGRVHCGWSNWEAAQRGGFPFWLSYFRGLGARLDFAAASYANSLTRRIGARWFKRTQARGFAWRRFFHSWLEALSMMRPFALWVRLSMLRAKSSTTKGNRTSFKKWWPSALSQPRIKASAT